MPKATTADTIQSFHVVLGIPGRTTIAHLKNLICAMVDTKHLFSQYCMHCKSISENLHYTVVIQT